MKKFALSILPLFLLSAAAFASWDDANGRGLVPYWQSVDIWYTLVVVVNGSEDNYDTFYLRFFDVHGNLTSGALSDMFSIRPGEQLAFSTFPGVGYSMPVNAIQGYIKFRVQDGGYIHVYTVIYNRLTSGGFVVPSYNQDHGF